MILATCIQKFRDKNNIIIGYRLQDSNGAVIDVEPQKLKAVILSGQLEVSNLKLTSDGRLIDKRESTVIDKKENKQLELSYKEKQKLLQYVNQKYNDNFYHYVFGPNFGLILHPCRRSVNNGVKSIYTHIINIRVKDKEISDIKLPMFTEQRMLSDGDNFIVIARVASKNGAYGSETLEAYGAFKNSFGKIEQIPLEIAGSHVLNIDKELLKKIGNTDTFEPIEFYNIYKDGSTYILEFNYNFKLIVDIQNKRVEVTRK